VISRRARAALLALSLLAPPACRAPAPQPPAAAAPRAVLEGPSGRSSIIRLEVMRSPAELERGLMFRQHLGADEGMLFVFPDSADRAFWMKNTLIPLDMIFVGEDGVVVGVVANAEPLTTTPRRVGVPSRYVLEVNGGYCAARGVGPGDRVRLEGVAR